VSIDSLLLERVQGLAAELPEEARLQALRVVELARALAARARREGKLQPEPGDLELKRELGRLSELLGRRTSKALPAASLGRAALADLGFDLRSCEAACADCDRKLEMLGW
jgi:hypothetical protein